MTMAKIRLRWSHHDGGRQLTVRVVGQPSGIEIGTRVRFRDLSARTWEMGDRHGVSFKASRVEPWVTGRSSGEGKAA